MRHALWRAWRDELELDDLEAAGIADGKPRNPPTKRALDLLWKHLTPGPFPSETR